MPVVKPKGASPIEEAIFHLTPEYGWVLLVASFLLIQCFLFGFIIVGYYRKKVFTQEFLTREFGKIHKDTTTEDIKEGGYPDMGAGQYSQKLSYADWLSFNKAQRIHQNFLETLAVSVILLLIAGLNFPLTATLFGTLQIAGRFCSVAYISTKGQAHILRVASSLLSIITNIAQFILCFIVVVQILSRK